MTTLRRLSNYISPVALLVVLGGALFGGLTGLALAKTPSSVSQPPTQDNTDELSCEVCHQAVVTGWEKSPHHGAFSDEKFQTSWESQDKDPRCLECHTTDFSPATGEYAAEGVSCTACHGTIPSDHPTTPVDLSIATNACKDCHVVTYAEFRASMHEARGLTCTTCHYAHENGLRLGDQLTQCLNCHGEQLTDFAHVSHVNAGLLCRHCHGYVEPGQEIPVDGLVPTGHDFRESVRACLDCHKDIRFVPMDAAGSPPAPEENVLESGAQQAVDIAELRARVETLDIQSQNRTITGILYGGIGGLVIGGVVAWFVARRVGKRPGQGT